MIGALSLPYRLSRLRVIKIGIDDLANWDTKHDKVRNETGCWENVRTLQQCKTAPSSQF